MSSLRSELARFPTWRFITIGLVVGGLYGAYVSLPRLAGQPIAILVAEILMSALVSVIAALLWVGWTASRYFIRSRSQPSA